MKSITRIILEEIQKFGNAVLNEDGDVVADIINAEYNKDNVVLEANIPSNLNDNFWKWFGNSKVVKNGKPLIMHHGGSFSPHKAPEGLTPVGNDFRGTGWFTSDKNSAKFYAKQSGGGNFTSVYIKIENPLYSGYLLDGNYRETNNAVRNAIDSGKYDGVIALEKDGNIEDAIVWNSQQIKSIDNNGEYNSSEPDVTKENLSEDDYRGSHRAPGPDSDDSPMYDLTNTYGKDIYGPQALRHFGNYRPYDAYTIALIQQAKDKPNYQVKIYRAIPKVISNQEKIDDYTKRMKYILKTGKIPNDVDNFKNSSEYYDWLSDEIEKLKSQVVDNHDKVKINNGDWVTINPAYAKEHGQSNVGNFRVLSKTVSAKNLYNEGDINEWGYIESQGLTENNSSNQKKLYYHGRNVGNRPYNSNYIFITDNLGYASGYSDGKTLYTYTMPFGEQKLFSIRNPEHRNLLSKYVDTESILHMRSDSGPDQELDWAAISYINSDEFDQPEDLLEHLGFLGMRLKERTGIESIYIFDQKNLKFEGEIDITTPEMIKQIGKFYKDFTKGKNFLETTIKEETHDFIESIADKYAERQFNIQDPEVGMNQRALSGLETTTKDKDDKGELVGNIHGLTKSKVFVNPRSLKDFEAEVRAVSDSKGNLFVAQLNGHFYHDNLVDAINNSNTEYSNTLGDTYSNYDNKVLLQRIGKTRKFGLSDSYDTYASTFPEDVQELLNKVKNKNPQFDFYPLYYNSSDIQEDNETGKIANGNETGKIKNSNEIGKLKAGNETGKIKNSNEIGKIANGNETGKIAEIIKSESKNFNAHHNGLNHNSLNTFHKS